MASSPCLPEIMDWHVDDQSRPRMRTMVISLNESHADKARRFSVLAVEKGSDVALSSGKTCACSGSAESSLAGGGKNRPKCQKQSFKSPWLGTNGTEFLTYVVA